MRVLSFNVQNLRLRLPDGQERLDGARDGFGDADAQARALDFADRRLTAQVLAQADADVCALQEVFDRETLDYFHDHLLAATKVALYPWRACIPGNDGAGRDVAVMARQPFAATSYAGLAPRDLWPENANYSQRDRPVFCRDCLMVEMGAMTLFTVHFKAPWPDRKEAWERRRAEALAVRTLIERRFPKPGSALWMVIGDLNDPLRDAPRAIAPLLDGFGIDLTTRMSQSERWTWWHDDGIRGCPDGMIASPALAARWPDAVPVALRLGMARDAGGLNPRLTDVGDVRPRASDHAALVLDLPGL